MENPKEDVKKVIQQLVCRPTLTSQAEVVRTYFTSDAKFFHFYVTVAGGRNDLTAIYQMAEIFGNYQAVQFHGIVYDEAANAMSVHMTVYACPWQSLRREHGIVFFTLLELVDRMLQDGRNVKLIKIQRDFIDRSVTLAVLPIIGLVYNSTKLRTFISNIIVFLAKHACSVVRVLYPHKV
ncbi:hypothetical protein KP509_06G074500 [Ceratopteris richardii]|uniref:SigF-like NTF2-like domain-containing protein n=1 Tax=Ceratopteris richardii TaxID=49495 RepID=A0A8T2UP60_CERRI|nr:hypothetical protein KP509_06G074500 [Ceratopteris richardii]